MKEIRQIIQAYEQAHREDKKAVLATVVHIEGSSYRAPGARMLITEDGRLTGAISGGCLEGDVMRKALLVIRENKPMLVTYDTTDEEDAVIGISLGCNGIIRILLEPLDNTADTNAISLLQLATQKRQPAVVVTVFALQDKNNPSQGTSLAFLNNGIHTAGTPAITTTLLQPDIQKVLAAKAPEFVQYPPADIQDPAFTAFIEYIAPMPALIVAGAGNDVIPLARMAEVLGWEVTLVDGRPAYATGNRFPGCQVRIAKPEAALAALQIDEQTAILLMSHNYHYDKAILQPALQSATPYIGILGPHKKKERLLRELQEEGMELTPAMLTKVYGPTGLDIGAETAEEIALSILAEIKTVFAGKSGTPLRNISGAIHQRQTQINPSLQSYAILLLAAGESKRLGTAKQELLYHGNTLLRHAVSTAQETGTAAVVVVGNDEKSLQDQLEGFKADRVINTMYHEGMASSIRAGVKHIMELYPQVSGILVMLCDQPHVTATHLRTLIETQQAAAAPVVASYYAERKGVPALFHASLFPQLLALQGDTGAKHLITALGDAVIAIPFPEGALDIDTPEQYAAMGQ